MLPGSHAHCRANLQLDPELVHLLSVKRLKNFSIVFAVIDTTPSVFFAVQYQDLHIISAPPQHTGSVH